MPNETDRTAEPVAARVGSCGARRTQAPDHLQDGWQAGDFPVPLRISPGAVRWPLSEIETWIKDAPARHWRRRTPHRKLMALAI